MSSTEENSIEPANPIQGVAGEIPEELPEGFEGDVNEENSVAKTAGEESHEDPWAFADLDAPNSPPEGVEQ